VVWAWVRLAANVTKTIETILILNIFETPLLNKMLFNYAQVMPIYQMIVFSGRLNLLAAVHKYNCTKQQFGRILSTPMVMNWGGYGAGIC
jgi:hypothetical protein